MTNPKDLAKWTPARIPVILTPRSWNLPSPNSRNCSSLPQISNEGKRLQLHQTRQQLMTASQQVPFPSDKLVVENPSSAATSKIKLIQTMTTV